MTRYEQVQEILEDAVQKQAIGRHGNFWRGKTRDQFVELKVFGRAVVVIGHGADSNLVRALRGQAPFDGSQLPRMPVGFDPVTDKDIQTIQKWIDDGCPETEMPQTTNGRGGVRATVCE
jgi:hypothetical protein